MAKFLFVGGPQDGRFVEMGDLPDGHTKIDGVLYAGHEYGGEEKIRFYVMSGVGPLSALRRLIECYDPAGTYPLETDKIGDG